MTHIWQYLLIVNVIFLQSKSLSPSYIYQIVDGSLTKPFTFNFTLFIKDYQGIIFQCIDSEEKIFEMKSSIDTRGPLLVMRFQKTKESRLLEELCGCKFCNNEMMIFSIKFDKIKISINCNNLTTSSWQLRSKINKDHYFNKIIIPNELKNVSNKIYITMGNFPSQSFSAVDQMVGCLYIFYYNNVRISFHENGTKFQSTCKCINNSCKNNECIDERNCNTTFNCFFITSKEWHCIRRFNEKTNKGNTTNDSNLYLSMTWKQNFDKIYCLLQIKEERHKTIWSYKNKLMMDNISISELESDGINTLRVIMNKTSLVLKIKEVKNSKYFFTNITINIGLSEKNKVCGIFSEIYYYTFPATEIKPEKKRILWIIVISCIVSTIILILLILMIKWIVNKIKSRINNSLVEATPQLRDHVDQRPESHVYNSLDERAIYINNFNLIEDIDGYILPRIHESEEQSPTLPPRNDE